MEFQRLAPRLLPLARKGVVRLQQIREFTFLPVGRRPDDALRLGTVAWTGNCLVGFFVLGLGIWSVFAPLSSAAIASGVVEPESSRKTVQHLEGGIVRAILVRNGDRVVAGQALVRLDDTQPRSERDALLAQYWDARIREARLRAEQDDSRDMAISQEIEAAAHDDAVVGAILGGQRKIFHTRYAVEQSQREILRQRIGEAEQQAIGLAARKTAIIAQMQFVRRETDAASVLVAKKLERQSRLLELGRETASLTGQLGETGAQILQAGQNLNESHAELLKFEGDRQEQIARELRETGDTVFRVGKRLQAVADQLARTEIRAPIDGTVANLRIHTREGVIGPGEPLLDLVPAQDRLVVTVHIKPTDINVVHVGLTARVHFLPYDQRRVPLVVGRVDYVSADRIVGSDGDKPYYAATISIDPANLALANGVSLISGMPVQALIETGQSTVAVYALRPLIDSFGRAFREN